ncbi:hypothetical protein NAP1_10463 [Erythrobacter sp. NAP1]|uniref:hypothetical protein n=1 Tax=Erythrobacter sp. NAP1 TaxID=237727 RepID=UPI00006878C1|nr:hypothetical protein [Erythrobacter sp. NAP1]EAQ28010.1 hypothetical protein NAP1_10463 [Erythrobacter sp. NAP1]
MKKTILGSASIFALALTAPAMAQSDPLDRPTPPSSPTPAPATTDCPPGANNCSLVEQDGTGLVVEVDQTGSDNVSDIDQINGSFGDGTIVGVDVDQTGTNAQSYVLQDGTGLSPNRVSRANVSQAGDGAESTILQDGTTNFTANVTQDGENDSFVLQTDGFLAGGTQATIDQGGGDLNTAVTVQLGGNSGRATTTQTGNRNNAETFQGDTTNRFGLRSTINQTGDDNDAFVSQNTDAGASVFPNISNVRIDQSGNDNAASIVQTGDRGGQANNTYNVDLDQNGNDNVSRVVQVNGSSATPSTILVTQNDDGNDSFVDQSSGEGTVNVTQNSTDTSGMVSGTDRFNVLDSAPDGSNDVFDSVRANFSNVVQSGDGITDATVSQTGFGNRSDLRQDNPTAATTAIATATQEATLQNSDIQQLSFGFIQVRQGITDPTSSNNDSLVIQADDASTVFVEQLNSNNISQVEQALGGGGNFASVFQRGLGGFSGVEQTGNGNFAELTQGDLSEDSVSLIVQNGDTNIADVDQTGVGDFSSVSQTGIGNTATVNQGP